MSDAVCPSCGVQVSVKGTPKIGMSVTCMACDTELDIVWLDPLELDWPIEDDDFDEDVDEE
ncbi:MAG: hypothetical protein KF698_08575 [Anaerolineales bacterium]|nr:hypothetical protein [Anaerolineales bacterium]